MIRKVMAGFFQLFSITYLYFALQLRFGSMTEPQSGFLPILAGGLATLFSLVDFISILKNNDEQTQEPLGLKVIVYVMIVFAVYIFLLNYIPYLLATFIALLFLLKISNVKGWVKPLSIAGCSAFGFYFVFSYLLNVPFP